MAKVTLSDVSTGVNQNTLINDNQDLVETALNDKVLYRDNPTGEANEMKNLLDMNSNTIINLPTPSSSSEPATKAYVDALGAPTTTATVTTTTEVFTATASQTVFTLVGTSYTPGSNNLDVYINGVHQDASAYSETSSTVITLSAGAVAGDTVFCKINQRAVDGGTYLASNVTYSPSGASAVDSDVQTKLRESISIMDFGAVGDGASPTADTAAFAAAALIGGRIYMPAGTYSIDTGIVFAVPITLVGEGIGKTIIKHDLGAGGGDVFKFTTDDVVLRDFGFDGTDHTATLTSNTRCIFLGDGSTTYTNHSLQNVSVVDAAADDGLTHSGGNILVTHAFYADNLENLSIRDCFVSDISGAAIFVRDVTNGTIEGNKLKDTGWYTIHLVGGAFNFDIENNLIDNAGTAEGIFYGGGIDLMSQHSPLETRNEHIRIVNNDISGFYAYGSAIRIMSAENIRVVHNWIHDWGVGTDPSGGSEVTAIRVGTRGTGVGAENGPCQHIVIKDNVLEAPTGTSDHRGIYVDNFYQSTALAFKNLIITGNEIESVNTTTRYFSSCIAVHGGSLANGGIENVIVRDNFCQGVALTGQVVDGLIGFVAAGTGSAIERVYLGSNFIRDLGTPASSWQLGIGIGAYVQEVYSTPNFIQNCFHGIRTFANSSVVDQSLAVQNWLNNTTDLVLNVDLTASSQETATGTFTLSSEGVTLIDSSGGAVTGTLGNGYYRGQEKTIIMTDATNSSTVSVTNHETSDPEVITFAAVDDTARLLWTGTEWITIVLSGATV